MSNIASTTLEQDPASDEARVLGLLDAGGFSHIIVDRTLLPPNWDQNVMLNEEFLRRNTVLVGGDHNVYLYRLVPAEQRGHEQAWAQGRELLPNGGFEEPDRGAPARVTPSGRPKYDTSGQGYETTPSAVRLRDGVSLAPQFALSPAPRTCSRPRREVATSTEWRDSMSPGLPVTGKQLVPRSRTSRPVRSATTASRCWPRRRRMRSAHESSCRPGKARPGSMTCRFVRWRRIPNR